MKDLIDFFHGIGIIDEDANEGYTGFHIRLFLSELCLKEKKPHPSDAA